MASVEAVMAAYRAQPEPPEGVTDNPFRLSSTVEEPAGRTEVEQAWPGRRLPEQLTQVWAAARGARLFVDVEYGQWGLVLLSPAGSAERTAVELQARPGDFHPDDIVVGEFLGDQELLVLARTGEGHRVLVALPLDERADWDVAADDLGQFLASYLERGGDKYWEQRSQG